MVAADYDPLRLTPVEQFTRIESQTAMVWGHHDMTGTRRKLGQVEQAAPFQITGEQYAFARELEQQTQARRIVALGPLSSPRMENLV